jgi:hypothetical protein
MEPEQIPIRDLHLPEAIGWWPPAPGWLLLLALVAAGLIWLLLRYLKARARGAARREALRSLEALLEDYEAHKDAARFGAGVSALLRRTMIAYAPRSEVAGLTGEDWLRWLDKGLAQPQFANGPGRKLLELPYRRPDADVPSSEIYALVTAVRQRVATPLGDRS